MTKLLEQEISKDDDSDDNKPPNLKMEKSEERLQEEKMLSQSFSSPKDKDNL